MWSMIDMLFTLHGRKFNLTHMQELGERASWILSVFAREAAGVLTYLPWKATLGETLLQLPLALQRHRSLSHLHFCF